MSMIRTCVIVINGVDPVRYLSAIASHAREARRAPQAWLPWTYPQTLCTLN